MRILFIYPNLGNILGFNIGIAILSALLKERSHEVKLIHYNENINIKFDEKRLKEVIDNFRPGVIGISTNTNQFQVSIMISKTIKKINKNIPIILGGIHPTLNPLESLSEESVDMIILGEGEEAILEIVEKLEHKEDVSQIKNLWLKRDHKVIKNKLRPFINLDKVPFMDVSIYEYQKILDLRNGWADVILNRGCPYDCSYCFNNSYKELYKTNCEESQKYIRSGDYKKTIDGIIDLTKKYNNIRCISFVDDDFLIFPDITEFLRLYKEKINLPFVVNTNFNSITLDKVLELKKSGCDLIRVGIESGNEELRKNILNRSISNQTMVEKSNLIINNSIRLFTYNMIGLPNEKKGNVIETLKINAKIGPDVVKISTFYPYPKTEIYERCKKLGLISEENGTKSLNYYETSILNLDDEFKLFIKKVQKHPDIYLNYYNYEISSRYKQLIEEIENLSAKELDNPGVQKNIQNKKLEISKRLNSQKIPHYKIKYASYFAVKTPFNHFNQSGSD